MANNRSLGRMLIESIQHALLQKEAGRVVRQDINASKVRKSLKLVCAALSH